MSAPIRIEMSLLTMSSSIWLRWGYLLCISCFNIFCGGKFNLWTTHALRTYRCPGYCLEEIDKVTNFDLTVANFDIAFDLFNRFISLFSWIWCAKLEVIKVASEPESRSALTANVLEPWLIFTEITWRNLILPTFCICRLKVLLVLACSCMSFWCNKVCCFLPQRLALHFHFHIQSFISNVFEKKFVHSICFVTNSILSVTYIFLNWEQSIKWCLSSQSQHVSFSLLSSGFDDCSFLSWFFYWVSFLIKLECTLFLEKWSSEVLL